MGEILGEVMVVVVTYPTAIKTTAIITTAIIVVSVMWVVISMTAG